MIKPKINIPEEKNRKFDDNAFKRAQNEAQSGEAPQKPKSLNEKTGPDKKAEDDLFRGNQSEREWSSESDEYRRES